MALDRINIDLLFSPQKQKSTVPATLLFTAAVMIAAGASVFEGVCKL